MYIYMYMYMYIYIYICNFGRSPSEVSGAKKRHTHKYTHSTSQI